MKRLPLLFCLFALALGLVASACGDTVRPSAATVNGTTISQSAVDDELEAIEGNQAYITQIESGGGSVRGQGKGTLSNAFVSRVLTRQIFLQLVHNEVVRKKLTVTTTGTEAQVEQSVGGKQVWDKFPKAYRETLVRRNAEVSALQSSLSSVKVDAAAIKAYYDEHASEFSQTCVSHILFSVNDATGAPDQAKTAAQADALKAQAADVKRQIDGGADFAAMAKQYSTDGGSKDTGGDLQCGPAGRFVPEFEQAMDKLAVGQVSDPVQTQFGQHLIKVTDRKQQPIEEVTPQIQQQLEAGGQQALSEFLQKALTKAKVTVNPRYGKFSKDPQSPGVIPPEAPPTTEPGPATPSTQPIIP
jgi:hypothetical protein